MAQFRRQVLQVGNVAQRLNVLDLIGLGGDGPAKRGRPAVAHHPDVRQKRIAAVGQMLLGSLTPKQAGAAFGVHRRTLYRWRAELLADGESDTEGLRRLAR
jgi:hypothetical protein